MYVCMYMRTVCALYIDIYIHMYMFMYMYKPCMYM